MSLQPTLIYRHRRENLKKCSLRGLEGKEDFLFFTYPNDELPSLDNRIVLTLGAPVLTKEDAPFGLVVIDGTWRLAQKMISHVKGKIYRTLPEGFMTAYPRRQEDCPDKTRGLASIEAVYIAHHILGLRTEGLLDNYHWKDDFLKINEKLF